GCWVARQSSCGGCGCSNLWCFLCPAGISPRQGSSSRLIFEPLDASPPSFEQSLAGVGGVSLAATRAIALSLALRPILASAILTFAIFISPFRHPVFSEKKSPSKGPEPIGLNEID